MEWLKMLDQRLSELFKGAPQFSAKNKETLVAAWPWIAVIGGILQLAAAWSLWQLTTVTSGIVGYTNHISDFYGIQTVGPSGLDKFVIYIGLIVLATEGVILLLAFPKLKSRLLSGWNLLFLGATINLISAVVDLFINGRGISSFIMSVLTAGVAFWLLYQVKGFYTDDTKSSKPARTDSTPSAPKSPKTPVKSK